MTYLPTTETNILDMLSKELNLPITPQSVLSEMGVGFLDEASVIVCAQVDFGAYLEDGLFERCTTIADVIKEIQQAAV